jgi:hypothetical protein
VKKAASEQPFFILELELPAMKLMRMVLVLLAPWLAISFFLALPKTAAAVVYETKVRNGKTIMCVQSGLMGAWEECGTENYVAVFRGKVTKVVEISEWELELTVSVDEVFKGDVRSIVKFGTAQGICFDDLNQGSEWLFFLEKDEKTGAPYLNYFSHNPSGPIAARSDGLERLRQLKSSPSEGMIIGSVHSTSQDRPTFESSPVPDYKVVARDSRTGKEYKATTDSKGNFSLKQLPAGSYSLTPSRSAIFPEDLAKKFRLEMDVAPRGCYQVDLAAGK